MFFKSKTNKFSFNILYSAFFILFLVPILYSLFLILDFNKPDSLTRELVNPLIINKVYALEPTQTQLDQTASILSSIQSIINKLKIDIQALFGREVKAATETVGLVRQDCTGYSNCFTSLSAWEAAYGGITFGACVAGDLVCADKIAIAQIDGAWTSADTTAVTIDGWTTDTAHYIRIYTTTAARHSGKWDTGKYRLEVFVNGSIIQISESDLIIEGLQIANSSDSVSANGIYSNIDVGRIKILSNIVRKTDISIGAANGFAIAFGTASTIGDIIVANNVVFSDIRAWVLGIYTRGSLVTSRGIQYNNTVYGADSGFRSRNNFNYAFNNLSIGALTNAYLETNPYADAQYNGYDIGLDPGTNGINLSAYSDNAIFIDVANKDFHLIAGSPAIDVGINLSNDAKYSFSTDIDGNTRPVGSAWDIGADEESTTTPPPDTIPPIFSAGSPTGALPSGTTQTTLSVEATDASSPVSCKYSQTPGTAYSSMTGTLSTANGTTFTATITGLTNGTFYNYYIRCQDTAGNANTTDYTISFSVSAPTGDTTPPTISITSPINGTTVSGTITITANATDNIGVAGAQFKLDNSNLGTEDTTSPYSYSLNTTTIIDGSHTLLAVARDTSNNYATSSIITVIVNNASPPPPDITPPSTPTGFTAQTISSSQINLSWTASTDDVGVVGYHIERCQGATCTNFIQIATPIGIIYSDTGLSASTTYRYQVVAQDAAGNLSNYSTIVSATTQSNSNILFSKNFNSEPYGWEGEYPGKCSTYPNWNLCGTNHWAFQHLPTGGWNGTGGARLIYRQGYEQESMGWINTLNLKNWQQGDGFYVRFKIKFDPTMRWDGTGSQQNKMIVWGSGSYGGTSHRVMFHQERPHGTSPCALMWIDYSQPGNPVYNTPQEYGLPPGSFDNGEYGSFSLKRNIGPYCTKPVPVTYNKWYHIQYYVKSGTTADTLDSEFKVWVNNNNFSALSSQLIGGFNLAVANIWTQFQFGGFWSDLNNNRDVSWVVDDFQIAESFDPQWDANILPDTQAPTTPTTLTATAVSSSQINLSWTASTDTGGSGLAGYKIYRCSGSGCTPTVQIATSATNSYPSTGLTASTAYTYAVSAYDAAGNESAKSSSVSAATQSLAPQCSDTIDNDSDGKIDFGGVNPDPDCSSLTDTTENDTTPPTISSVISTTLASTTARIDWQTNEPATSQVEYGFTTQYGASSTLNSTLATSHSVLLSNLSPGNTTYNFRVRSKDSSNNEAISINYSFITPGLTDIIPPASTTNFTANNITQTAVDLFTWTAAGDDGNSGTAFSFDIRYATGELSENTWNNGGVVRATGEPTPKIAGSVMNYTLVGLTPNTTYKAALKTLDEILNQSLISNIITFTTLAAQTTPQTTTTSSSGGSSSSGGGGGSSTISDTTPPPQITALKSQGADKQVRLTWENPLTSSGQANPDWVRTIIVKKVDSFATSTKDGDIIYEGTDNEFTDINLRNNQIYYYSIFTIDKASNYSDAALASAKTIAGKVSLEKIIKEPLAQTDQRAQEIITLAGEAAEIIKSDIKSFLNRFNFKRDQAQEDLSLKQYVKELIKGIKDLMADRQIALNHFIAYGTATTLKLGAGERAGVVNSYKSAFNQLPTTAEEWTDALKIANGRWPSQTSPSAETKASQEFKKVYKRAPNLKQANDNAAVTVMAYGLRPSNRNLNSEKAAIKSFRAIYGYNPKSAISWDIVRAVAYSGAKR